MPTTIDSMTLTLVMAICSKRTAGQANRFLLENPQAASQTLPGLGMLRVAAYMTQEGWNFWGWKGSHTVLTPSVGSAGSSVSQGLKEAKVGEHLAFASEKGKEYGARGWGFLKSAYATVASNVEHVARENGYRVDLGSKFCVRLSCPQTWISRSKSGPETRPRTERGLAPSCQAIVALRSGCV